MATSYPFERLDENSLIELTAELNDSSFSVILDTGATHTVIDFGVLIEEGYLLDDTKGLTFFETANGIKEANIFQVKQLSCLASREPTLKYPPTCLTTRKPARKE